MPALYSAETRLYEGDQLKDIYTTPFGIRSIEIIPNKGFFLNGEKTVFKGVCNHHDLGPLGAAVNDARYPSSDPDLEGHGMQRYPYFP